MTYAIRKALKNMTQSLSDFASQMSQVLRRALMIVFCSFQPHDPRFGITKRHANVTDTAPWSRLCRSTTMLTLCPNLVRKRMRRSVEKPLILPRNRADTFA